MATVGDGFKIGLGILLLLVFLPVATCVACGTCVGVTSMAGASSSTFQKDKAQAEKAQHERAQAIAAMKHRQAEAKAGQTSLHRGCKVRSAPGKAGAVIGFAKAGTYKLLGRVSGWRHIQVNGKLEGWVGCKN